MKSRAFCFTRLSTIAICIAVSLPAQAQQRARVFVSVNGNDANPCTALSPCKTFQRAHDAVLAGGEISVLDTGGYGTLIISKAISIVAIGVQASIAIPAGVAGITINAGSNDKVSLRGLTLDGTGVGGSGIVFTSGAALTITNCVVRNVLNSGIANAPTTSAKIFISDTIVSDNGGDGIYVQPSGSNLTVSAMFNRVQAYNNAQQGIAVFSNSMTGSPPTPLIASAVDSVSANNSGNGFYALGGSIFSLFHLFRSAAFHNGVSGAFADTSSTFDVGQSDLPFNLSGPGSIAAMSNASITTYQDNYTTNDGFTGSSPIPKF